MVGGYIFQQTVKFNYKLKAIFENHNSLKKQLGDKQESFTIHDFGSDAYELFPTIWCISYA